MKRVVIFEEGGIRRIVEGYIPKRAKLISFFFTPEDLYLTYLEDHEVVTKEVENGTKEVCDRVSERIYKALYGVQSQANASELAWLMIKAFDVMRRQAPFWVMDVYDRGWKSIEMGCLPVIPPNHYDRVRKLPEKELAPCLRQAKLVFIEPDELEEYFLLTKEGKDQLYSLYELLKDRAEQKLEGNLALTSFQEPYVSKQTLEEIAEELEERETNPEEELVKSFD
jgi:hypothetical protein